MAPAEAERRLAAILSADVVGYSRLMAADEAGTVERLKTYRDAMSSLIRLHGGRVVDAVGDNLLAEFPSVVDAVACGVAAQEDLAKRNEELPDGQQMRFRIGIHVDGDAAQPHVAGAAEDAAGDLAPVGDEDGGEAHSRNTP